MSPYHSSLVPRVTETLHRESLFQAKSHADAVSTFYRDACILDFRTTDKVQLPPINNFIRKYRSEQNVKNAEDDIWSHKIPAAVDLLKESAHTLHKEQYQSQRRIQAHMNVLKNTTKRLKQARQNLDSTRRTIFLDVVRLRSNSCGTATPPSLVHTPDVSERANVFENASGEAARAQADHTVRDDLMEVLNEDLDEALPDYLPTAKYYDDDEES